MLTATRAADVLLGGGVIAYPTEGVFGLGCLPDDVAAIKHLLDIKQPGKQVHLITDLQRVSRPGCRIYCGKTEIPRVYGGLGINILSTSRGVMTGREAAKTGVGGEILCKVY